MSLEGTGSAVAVAKTTGYIGAIAFFEYLGISQTQFAILALLMFLDFMTWVGKVYVIDSSKITSHEAWIGVVKKLGTLIFVFTVALMFKGLGIPNEGYIQFSIALLIMAEAYSSIQNVYAIRTGKVLPEFDVISILLKSFGDMIKNKIEALLAFNSKK